MSRPSSFSPLTYTRIIPAPPQTADTQIRRVNLIVTAIYLAFTSEPYGGPLGSFEQLWCCSQTVLPDAWSDVLVSAKAPPWWMYPITMRARIAVIHLVF